MEAKFFIKTNRIFTPLRNWSWVFILLVAFAGLWYPKLGLLMIPVMIALPIFGFKKGKFWCGNICPHGSLFDRFILQVSANKRIPSWAISKITIGLALFWFMYMLGNRLVKVSELWGSTPFLDKLGFIFVMNYLVVTIVGTILAVFISPRTWCRFCPMGSVQILLYKLGTLLGMNKASDEKVTIASTEACHKCAKCSRVCPVQLTPYLEVSENNQLNNAACIRCGTCVVNCPAKILSLNSEEEAINISKTISLDGYRNRKEILATISDINYLDNNVREYIFELRAKLDFKPGQFILVKIQDNPEMYRAYSVSDYDENSKKVRITIKQAPNGYGTGIIFNSFKKGDSVQISGPMGNELVVDKDADKVVFVAGGIGITPFVPLVREMIEKRSNIKDVKLIYGVNKEDEFLYDEFFKEIENKNDNFEYIKVVAMDEQWQGRKGFVTDVLKEMQFEDYKIYLCGPLPMTNATLTVLSQLGVNNQDINYESA
ncbi:MAG: ferredoxin--NAD(+) reductase [Desulfitibacter sp. BRH_c19]|nr:MAG: ferredoxin--NAD(+) reductase [Desulfitibacter sp. BRH_c19]